MKSPNTYIVVYVTFPTQNIAKKVVHELVEEKLAACGNIFRLYSIYRWKNRIEQDSEYGTLIKTKKKLFKKVEQFIKKKHPYDVPEIISWTIDQGSTSYLEWIEETTADAKR